MAFLSFDIVVGILANLPVKSLMRFRCISKQCNFLISDSRFIKNHLQNMKSKDEHWDFILQRKWMDPEFLVLRIPSDLNGCEGAVLHAVETQAPQKIETRLIQQSAECDGMLCIPKGCSVLVWNPSTKVTRRIPGPPKPDRIDGIGFGYDCTIDDYKVVNIMRPRENRPTSIQSLRLRTGLWNTVQNHVNRDFYVEPEAGKSVNGCIYWIGNIQDVPRRSLSFLMVYFDLETEIVREEKFPSDILHDNVCVLGDLGGSLSLTATPGFGNVRHYDVWIKEENSWKILFRFPACCPPSHPLCFSIHFTRNGHVLTNEYTKDGDQVFLYNLRDESVKRIQVQGLGGIRYFAMIPYVESLVSPCACQAG
ncbi:hypothetical protein SLA2020_511780 [Shorea laevis]